MVLLGVGTGQEIDWHEYEGRTGIQINCDTPGISIYLNGDKVGVSPLGDILDVPEGWHHVSLFPEMEKGEYLPERVRDIQKLGSRRVLVKYGEVSMVTLSYRSLDEEADEIASEERGAAWVGYSLFLITIAAVIWSML